METFFEFDHSSIEKVALLVVFSLFSLSCCCFWVSIEKEKMACLSPIKNDEFAEAFGNESFIDLYPMKGANCFINLTLFSSSGHNILIMIFLLSFCDIIESIIL